MKVSWLLFLIVYIYFSLLFIVQKIIKFVNLNYTYDKVIFIEILDL